MRPGPERVQDAALLRTLQIVSGFPPFRRIRSRVGSATTSPVFVFLLLLLLLRFRLRFVLRFVLLAFVFRRFLIFRMLRVGLGAPRSGAGPRQGLRF